MVLSVFRIHSFNRFDYSYLKLYKTLPLSKLASFMRPVLERPGCNPDIEKELIKQLLCFKHKMKNMVWNKGSSGLDGSFQSGSEVSLSFYYKLFFVCVTSSGT